MEPDTPGPELAAAIIAVQDIAALEMRLTYSTARLAIEIAELEWKLAFARAVHDHAEASQLWLDRLNELAAQPPMSAPHAPYDPGSARDRVDAYLQELEALSVLCTAHLDAAHPVSDEPSIRLIRQRLLLIDDLAQKIRSVPVTGAGQATACGQITENGYVPPSRPARDAVFNGGAPPIDPLGEGVDLRSAALELMHANLTDLELSTIEICCLFILQNPDAPWGFVADMARQSWDEARHAVAFRDRILDLGGALGARKTNFTHWDIVVGQDLPTALTCHQMIGEWIGIDGALWFGSHFRDCGDAETGRVFDFVARDECTHVLFGNRWIEYFMPLKEDRDTVMARAEDVRRAHGKSVDGPLTFPLHEWACDQAGYRPQDKQKLVERYASHGSVIGSPE